eukprot:CAMPEP_0117441784 /NCGR_PEP_ID=MMETSP0759-20121206/3811_1 /TAXON_ID=63605 /ORGANISM="Percolomonas cosmopolitus, Strain WS" /LENGTH=951 /DNA_ID=CAMNT_0005233645 /DNA_START=250 /DNA_END=3105 /DNA_ORIENTATION=-
MASSTEQEASTQGKETTVTDAAGGSAQSVSSPSVGNESSVDEREGDAVQQDRDDHVAEETEDLVVQGVEEQNNDSSPDETQHDNEQDDHHSTKDPDAQPDGTEEEELEQQEAGNSDENDEVRVESVIGIHHEEDNNEDDHPPEEREREQDTNPLPTAVPNPSIESSEKCEQDTEEKKLSSGSMNKPTEEPPKSPPPTTHPVQNTNLHAPKLSAGPPSHPNKLPSPMETSNDHISTQDHPPHPDSSSSPEHKHKRKQLRRTHEGAPSIPAPQKNIEMPPCILVTVYIREIILSSDAEDSFFASLSIVYNTKPAQLYNISSRMDVPIPKTGALRSSQKDNGSLYGEADEKRTEVVRGNQLQFQSNCFSFDLQKSQINGEERLFPGSFLLKLWHAKGKQTAQHVASGEVVLNQIDHLISKRNGSTKIRVNLMEEPDDATTKKSVLEQKGNVYATSLMEFCMNQGEDEQDDNRGSKNAHTLIPPPQILSSVSPDISPKKSSGQYKVQSFEDDLHQDDDEDDSLDHSLDFEDVNPTQANKNTSQDAQLWSLREMQHDLKSKRATIDKLLEDICSKEDTIAALKKELKRYKKKCLHHEQGLHHLKERLAKYEEREKFHSSSDDIYATLQSERSRYERLERDYAKLKKAHRQQGQDLANSQGQTRKMEKYKTICSTQETVIEKLEHVLEKTMAAKRTTPRGGSSGENEQKRAVGSQRRRYVEEQRIAAPLQRRDTRHPSRHSNRPEQREDYSRMRQHKEPPLSHRIDTHAHKTQDEWDDNSNWDDHRETSHHLKSTPPPSRPNRIVYTRKQLLAKASDMHHEPHHNTRHLHRVNTPPPEAIEATRRSQNNFPHRVTHASPSYRFDHHNGEQHHSHLPSLFEVSPGQRAPSSHNHRSENKSLQSMLQSSEEQRLALESENQQLKNRTKRMEEILQKQIHQYSKEISDLKIRMFMQENSS